MESKEARNARVQARWDELWREGKHGHYETLFCVVREEVERAAALAEPQEVDVDDYIAGLEPERQSAIAKLAEPQPKLMTHMCSECGGTPLLCLQGRQDIALYALPGEKNEP